MPWFQSRNANLHYRDYAGSPGLTVIFLHGLWMSSSLFCNQTPESIGGHRVISLDFRGHGLSQRRPDGHTLRGYAYDVRRLIEHTKPETVVIAGWSMGALVAWTFLRMFGMSSIAGLIVIDQPAADFRWNDDRYDEFRIEELYALINAIQENQRDTASKLLQSMISADLPATTLQKIKDIMCSVSPSVSTSMLASQSLADMRGFVGQIRVPTLVCFGRDPSVYPVAAGEDIARRIAGSELIVFERSSHCPFIEEPESFNDAVATFLGRIHSHST